MFLCGDNVEGGQGAGTGEKRERELGDKGAGSGRAGYRKGEFLTLLFPVQWITPQLSSLKS